MIDNHQDRPPPPQSPAAASQVAYCNSVFKHAMLVAANQMGAFHLHPSAQTLWVNFQWSPTTIRLSRNRDTCKTICPWWKLAKPLNGFGRVGIGRFLRHSAPLPGCRVVSSSRMPGALLCCRPSRLLRNQIFPGHVPREHVKAKGYVTLPIVSYQVLHWERQKMDLGEFQVLINCFKCLMNVVISLQLKPP